MCITSNQEFVKQTEIQNIHVSSGQYIRVCSIILTQEYIYLWHTEEAKKDRAGTAPLWLTPTLTQAGISELCGEAGSTHAPTGTTAWFLSASTASTSLLFRGFKAKGNLVLFRGFLREAILPGICDSWSEEKQSIKSSNDRVTAPLPNARATVPGNGEKPWRKQGPESERKNEDSGRRHGKRSGNKERRRA